MIRNYLLIAIFMLKIAPHLLAQMPNNIATQRVTLNNFMYTCPDKPYRLVFFDEFNGTQLNRDFWFPFYPYGQPLDRLHSYNNIEDQVFLDENLVFQNGILKVTAKNQPYNYFGHFRNYTSGVIHSNGNNSFLYGKFEIRCKIPYGKGFWPAFWLYGGCDNEIDVFEFGGNMPSVVQLTTHSKYPCAEPDKHKMWNTQFNYHVDYSADFHTYTIEWEPNYLRWSVDGLAVREDPRFFSTGSINSWRTRYYCGGDNTILNGSFDENKMIPFTPMNIIAGLGISGKEDGPFTGRPDGTTPFPSAMEIDYIRVCQRVDAGSNADFCGKRKISGTSNICTLNGQVTYTLEGDKDAVGWSTSSNLVILNTNGRNITIKPVGYGKAWIKANIVDNTPCFQNEIVTQLLVGPPLPPVIADFFSDISRKATLSILADPLISSYKWYTDNDFRIQSNTTTYGTRFSTSGYHSIKVKAVGGCGESGITEKSFYFEPNQFAKIATYNKAIKAADSTSNTDNSLLANDDYSKKTYDNLYTVFPIPATNDLYIYPNKDDLVIKEINVYDVIGKLLISQNTDLASNKVDLSTLASGIYFVKIASNNFKIEVFKIIKE